MSDIVFGDLKAAEKSFDEEWRECGGEILNSADRRLALRCYQMGWVDSEFRFLKKPPLTTPTPAE